MLAGVIVDMYSVSAVENPVVIVVIGVVDANADDVINDDDVVSDGGDGVISCRVVEISVITALLAARLRHIITASNHQPGIKSGVVLPSTRLKV